MVSVQTILKGQHKADCFSELCRLCGNMKTPAISIFDKSSRLAYHDIINFHFKDIHVSESDILPLKLCGDCAKFILSWHRFHNECIQVNEALSSFVNLFPGNLFKSKGDLPDSKSVIEVIEVDAECVDQDLDKCEILSSVGAYSDKISETRNDIECASGRYVFVDASATTTKKKVESSNTKPQLSSSPLSTSDGSSNTPKCNKCGSVFLKSKVESTQNRGMCYSCYSKTTRNTHRPKSSISPIFLDYLVTDENKQSYFLCDLCNFSCEAFPDVFAHHYETEHAEANLYLSFANEKDDPLNKFAHEKNGVRSYRCDLCPMSCISRNLFVKHYTEHGNQTLIETTLLRIEFKGDKFYCAVCQKSYNNSSSAKKHLKRVHTEKKFKCSVCQKGFAFEYKARIHEERHLKIKSFMCDVCGRKFAGKENLENHLKKNLCSKYTCAWCCQCFASKSALRSHLTRCDQQKANSSIDETKVESVLKYECDKCKKKFKSKCLLRIHIIDEFNLKPYKCYICNQRFATTVLLKEHLPSCNKSILSGNQCDDFSLIVSTNKDSFGCKLCGRKFRKMGYLRQHFRLHKNTRPYVCEFCGKSYAQKASYRSHMLTEMNLRKYACSVCGKRYNSSSHLTAHIKKHHRLREFKCNTCDKEFAYERDLKEHEKTHTEIKAYFCDKCGSFFKTKRYLKVHWERCSASKN